MRGQTYSLSTENTGFVFLFVDSQGSYSASLEKRILGGRDIVTSVILNGIPGANFRRSRRRPKRCFQAFQNGVPGALFQAFQMEFQAPFSGLPDASEKRNLHALLCHF